MNAKFVICYAISKCYLTLGTMISEPNNVFVAHEVLKFKECMLLNCAKWQAKAEECLNC